MSKHIPGPLSSGSWLEANHNFPRSSRRVASWFLIYSLPPPSGFDLPPEVCVAVWEHLLSVKKFPDVSHWKFNSNGLRNNEKFISHNKNSGGQEASELLNLQAKAGHQDSSSCHHSFSVLACPLRPVPLLVLRWLLQLHVSHCGQQWLELEKNSPLFRSKSH